jgi:hypothetical protein
MGPSPGANPQQEVGPSMVINFDGHVRFRSVTLFLALGLAVLKFAAEGSEFKPWQFAPGSKTAGDPSTL